ncbi:ribulose bisphosphate carboxylase small chain, chloroplastic-like [Hibiscus syriacus]|uniref:ribulose bisphosphate carboxylase small chain, chloroplastic-like n=1 Tax=Hibiscus syriacus TaxID=106335 RepID=UPI00192415B9|nr:ribulose bisphosphate carboxylase small chain, chloroplastic-like [Hibiscus syriacus]
MASSMISSATIATVNHSSPAQANRVSPFTGLKSSSTFPGSRKANNDITSLASNGGRVQCMKVWPPLGKKKFETLSYLPTLTSKQLAKEIDYLLRSKLIYDYILSRFAVEIIPTAKDACEWFVEVVNRTKAMEMAQNEIFGDSRAQTSKRTGVSSSSASSKRGRDAGCRPPTRSKSVASSARGSNLMRG